MRGRAPLGLLALLTLAACNFPTEAPIFEPRFIVPGEDFSLGVAEVLPSSVQISGGAFTLSFNAGATVSRTLGEACPACVPLNGTTAPKPAFVLTLPTSTVNLPANVVSATITSGQIRVNFVNGFSFDPIRPTGNFGSLRLRVVSGNTVLADTTLSGQTVALPAGATTPITINLRPGVVSGAITAEATIDSPVGGPVSINTANVVSVTPTPQDVSISQATVTTANEPITVTETLDLEDIDDTVADHVLEGALIITIVKPANVFTGVTGNVSLTVEGAEGGAITKSGAINLALTTPQRVTFTQQELRRMLGHVLTLRIAGGAALSNTVVRPGDAVRIRTRLALSVTTESD